MKLQKQYSPEKIINSLKKANVALLNQNIYQTLYYDEILKLIDEELGTNLNQEYQTTADIRRLIADTK